MGPPGGGGVQHAHRLGGPHALGAPLLKVCVHMKVGGGLGARVGHVPARVGVLGASPSLGEHNNRLGSFVIIDKPEVLLI